MSLSEHGKRLRSDPNLSARIAFGGWSQFLDDRSERGGPIVRFGGNETKYRSSGTAAQERYTLQSRSIVPPTMVGTPLSFIFRVKPPTIGGLLKRHPDG